MATRYRTVVQLVEDEGHWAAFTVLSRLPYGERPERLVDIFKTTCEQRDDKAALRYFGWLMQALDDIILAPYINEEKRLLSDDRVHQGEIEALRKRNKGIRAQRAMELYAILPDHQNTPMINTPTLLGTRKAMLTEIAERWAFPESEEESDLCFDFLSAQISSTRFEEECKIIIEVVRGANGWLFPISRLTRHILRLSEKGMRYSEELISVLVVARARDRKVEESLRELSVLFPLEGCSPHVYRFMEKCAGEAAALDAKVRELIGRMQPAGSFTSSTAVYGEITIEYPCAENGNRFEVFVAQGVDYEKPRTKEYGNEQFEIARSHILAWQEGNREHLVFLSLRILAGSQEEEVFCREQAAL